jgi:RNA recognition motif-containing protein
MTMTQGFEIVPMPEVDLERIKVNLAEGRYPNFVGESKLYVGNIAFNATEEELNAFFAECGVVGEVALVRDDEGRNRGFGFVTMRTKEGGAKAMADLDGKEFNGRNIAVRESNG